MFDNSLLNKNCLCYFKESRYNFFQVVSLGALCSPSPAPQGGRQVEVTFVGDLEKTEHDVSGDLFHMSVVFINMICYKRCKDG